MNGLNIYLANGNYNGPVTMHSGSSKFAAVRVERSAIQDYETDLDGPGIYFLLVGNDSIYVGQTGLDTIKKRIMNTHTGDIDSLWHTVLGFKYTDLHISSNELEFIENAMCEYVHSNFSKCLTTTPAKANCNVHYRNQHYHLTSGQIHSCNQYIKDIEHYLSIFPGSVFPPSAVTYMPAPANKELFRFRSSKRDSDGQAEIGIRLGNKSKRPAILKAGSRVSLGVSNAFKGYQHVIAYRRQLESQGKLVNRVLQVDIPFESQSGAGQFLNGTSFNGNSNWKTVSGNVPLKDLLE